MFNIFRILSILSSLFAVLFTIQLVTNVEQCLSHRILAIFPYNSRSHMMVFEALMKGLVKRGHKVDVISIFPQKTKYPNYTDITISSNLPKIVNNLDYNRFRKVSGNNHMVHFLATKGGNELCERSLAELEEKYELFKNSTNNPPYDLVISQILGAHCFMAFGHLFKVPVVGISASVLYPWSSHLIGNPENLAFISNTLLEYKENMNFWQRLFNVVHTFYFKTYFNYYTSAQDEIIWKYFGSTTPGVRELERNLALVLTNSHFSINGVKPMTTAHIEIGGIHINNSSRDIPKEDKKWLDESTSGFIYFTFGSMVTIETFPTSLLRTFYKSLGKITPVRVFMKVPRPDMLPPGLPSNIRTFSWMPQLAVLKHKYIRGFITHGGLMGTQEAIYCAVPMIGVPLFADQYLNIDMYVKKKIAIRLTFDEISENTLDTALNEILYNLEYRDAAKNLSQKFLDRPKNSMDTAIYWIEYVIRHGNMALRSPALNYTWWQIALLDVYIFLLMSILSIFMIVTYYLFLLVKIVYGRYNLKSPEKLKSN